MLNKKEINLYDVSNMYKAIKGMHNQIIDSFKIMRDFNVNSDKYNNIIVCGMGGSAIGGDFVKNIVSDDIKIPFYVNRTYNLPKWVNESTLVILCSYSGETEETISCYNETISLGIKPIIISSNGFLLNEAINNKLIHIKLPKGFQPRAAFGYSSSILLILLYKIKLIDIKYINDLESSTEELKKTNNDFSNFESPHNDAVLLAKKIYNKYPIIYSSSLIETLALRFRGQLAENGKILSSHFVIPEQNHNEIEGFSYNNTNPFIIIWIQDINDHKQITKRIESTSSILSDYENFFYKTKGHNLIARMFNTIIFFDWVSFYVSMFYKKDPTPVNKIKKLKELLAK